MSYYITRQASKWAKSEKCSDAQLINALQEMERGLTGNALGANLYKKRIAVPGAGKSGGWRVIVATKFRGHWFVIHGFAKNVQANIDAQQLADLKVLSKALLSYDDLTIDRAVGIGVIRPITEEQSK